MTEEEAKTKSCCGPMQAEHGKTHVANCIGSACMAWRWEDVPNPEYAKRGGGQHFMQYPPPVLPPMYLKSEDAGRCGLAGKP